MSNRISSMIALFIVFSMIIFTVPVSATSQDSVPNETKGFDQPISNAEELLSINADTLKGTGYYLDSDIELSTPWRIKNIVLNFDLNGHNIIMTGNKTVIIITDATLNLYDSKGAGKITGGVGSCGSSGSGGGIAIGINSGSEPDTLNMYGGIISGNDAAFGGGVYIPTSSVETGNKVFNMYGGTIKDNNASKYGGGVQCQGTFTMTDGVIDNNVASTGGGGVSISSSGEFKMLSGQIKGNSTSGYGGGVYLSKSNGDNPNAGFKMDGGSISGNSSYKYGGGVQCQGAFTMTDGVISDNMASFGGGGINVPSDGIFEMISAQIKDNSSNEGGGIYQSGKTTMKSGSITDNYASTYGGGIFLKGYASFKMNGGSITGNDTPGYGGGVYLSDASEYIMNGGNISKNISPYGYSNLYEDPPGDDYCHEFVQYEADDGSGRFLYRFDMNGGTLDGFNMSKAPSSVAATLSTASGGYNDVKVSWSKVSGAKAYLVYYKTSSASKYSKYKKTSKTSYTFKNLNDGTKYNFKIVPCHDEYFPAIQSKKYKSTSAVTLKKVVQNKIKKNSSTKVTISWKNISGESGYQISRTTKKNSIDIVATIKSTSAKSKVLKVPKKGKRYYYKVRAYKYVKVGSKAYKVCGPWSSAKY